MYKYLKRGNFGVFLGYLFILIIIYAQVVFFGKTLLSSLYYPNQDYHKLGYNGRNILNTFNVDLASNAFYEEPINRLIGKLYLKGQLPLWNPYQGCGVPLAAQYSTRAFFPYQILENISPYWAWDYFILGRLLIAAFFTYLFLASIGLSTYVSFFGGVCYMLSGSLVWFINNEQFANVAMVIPMALFYFEKMIGNKNNIYYFVLSSIVIALVLLAGQPEIAIYVLLLAGAYYIFRILIDNKGISEFFKNILKFIFVIFLGLCAASIVILPFLEYTLHSYNCHPPGGTMGSTEGIAPLGFIIGLLVPYIFELPTHYRYFPHNGVWDYLGGYIGILPAFLLLLSFFYGKSRYRKYFLFFFLFSFSIMLKNFGFPLMVLIGRLPIFDQAWSPRWAGPVWTFSLACAAAIGLENIIGLPKNKKIISWAIALILLVIILIYYPLSSFWMESGLFNKLVNLKGPLYFKNMILPPLLSGAFVAICILSTLCFLFSKYKGNRTKNFILSILLLLIFELWFYIPQGMDFFWRTLKLIPFLFGILSIWALMKEKKFWKFLGIIAIIANILIDVSSPRGMPDRHNLFLKQPYIKFLEEQKGYYRVIGGDGILIPNFASAFGIFDIRYIDSMSPLVYQNYVDNHLLKAPHNFITDRLWFTGLPDVNKNFTPSIYEEIEINLPFYSFLGVKYILSPKKINSDFPLIYDKEIKIYENPFCLPRIFIVHDIEYADSYIEAQKMIVKLGFNARNKVILEEKVPQEYIMPGSADNSQASIVNYRSNKVVADVFLNRPGILVLTDVFYPRWKAYVDGHQSKIYRVNGLVRGVLLEKGKHIVVFEYFPDSFKVALGLSLISLLTYFIIIIKNKVASK